MEFTARLTANAEVKNLANERTVINFTVAKNDYYKPKGSSEGKQVTEFIQCAYWLNAKVAERLTKGALVEISGRIGVNAWVTSQGEARANLTCHVNKLTVHGSGKPKEENTSISTSGSKTTNGSGKKDEDDLPF